MARTCSICDDPNRDEIDRLGRLGDSIAKIAQKFALSYDALYRHFRSDHHIREVTAIPTALELSKSEDILIEINEHHIEAKRLRDQAKNDGDLKTALIGIDKALKCIELMAKIQGQVHEQNVTVNLQQINIYDSSEWSKVGDLLARILEPYPEIRIEVAKELLALQETHR
jgi:hypothetical protein